MVTKEDALELLEPCAEILLEVVRAAHSAEDLNPSFVMSKASIANCRHDAMVSKAEELLGEEFQRHKNSRTTMFANARFVLSLKKIEANGSVSNFPTERATSLKDSGNLTLFSEPEVSPQSLPIFYVGYQADKDSGEIEDYLISYYRDGKPVWVMNLDELLVTQEEASQSTLPLMDIPKTEAGPRTQVRIKNDLQRKRNDNESSR